MTGTCGCCEGVGKLGATSRANRPGLDVLRYRVGTHASFLENMIAALTTAGDPALEGLTARNADDPSLALVDAWATVADVLTFYQERIANEGYLRTATERRSILELGRLVGYEIRPGVASTVFLAYTLEQGYEVAIAAGARSQTLPGPGELPQSFETSAALEARESWNHLEPRRSRPIVIEPEDPGARLVRIQSAGSVETLYFAGTAANLKPNDRILLTFLDGKPYVRLVASSELQAAENRTKVTLVPEARPAATAVVEDITNPPDEPRRTGRTAMESVLGKLMKGPADRPLSPAHANRRVSETFAANADAVPSLRVAANPRLKETLYRAWENAKLTPTVALTGVAALRLKASIFGHNAPLKPILNSQGAPVGSEEWPLDDALVITVRLQGAVGAATDTSFARIVDTDARTGAAEIRVSISRGAAAGTATVSLVNASGEAAIDGVIITITMGQAGTEGGASSMTVVLAPGPANRFNLNQRRQFRFTAADGDSEEPPRLVLRVFVDDEPDERGHEVALGEPARFAVGARWLTVRVTEESLALTDRSTLESAGEGGHDAHVIALDSTYDQIVPGSWVLIERLASDGKKLPLVTRVAKTVTLTKTGYGITAKVTQLTLEDPWLDEEWLVGYDRSLAALRNTTVFAHDDPQQLAEEPILDDVADQEIALQGLYHGLESGRWLIVSGERTDIPETSGVTARELVMLSRIEQDVEHVERDEGLVPLAGSKTRSTLLLTSPLAYTYKRDTVRIYGNVVKATHGETRSEVLGSGDGSKAFQQFTLKQPPLTYIPATNASGLASTLEVRVNGVKWHHVARLVDAGPDDRCYTTLTDDVGQTTVVFGDGVHGARLPTELQNVTAVYRNGVGKPGNAAAGQITLLTTRPLGVKEVINPLAASGGADAESLDEARGNVPLRLLALDRLVSVADYEAFAKSFAGIGKAKAARLSDGRREIVHLTIAGADDIPIDESSDLYRHLNLALREFGDPHQAIHVESRHLCFLVISATVALLPDYQWLDVERRLRTALLDAFSFARRQLGQDVVLSEVIQVMHGVAGVAYVDVDTLAGVSVSSAVDELKDLGESLGLNQRVASDLARAPGQPAQLVVLTPDVPDTLILRGPEK